MAPTPRQLAEITAPPLLAVLATVNPDGSPQATPVWYHYDGEYFNTTAFAHRIKVRNIKRDPRVTLVIVDTANYNKELIVRGTAELVTDGVPQATLRNAVRYLGEERGTAEAAALTAGGPRVIIRVTPDRII